MDRATSPCADGRRVKSAGAAISLPSAGKTPRMLSYPGLIDGLYVHSLIPGLRIAAAQGMLARRTSVSGSSNRGFCSTAFAAGWSGRGRWRGSLTLLSSGFRKSASQPPSAVVRDGIRVLDSGPPFLGDAGDGCLDRAFIRTRPSRPLAAEAPGGLDRVPDQPLRAAGGVSRAGLSEGAGDDHRAPRLVVIVASSAFDTRIRTRRLAR